MIAQSTEQSLLKKKFTYFSLIEKVGTKGNYQTLLFAYFVLLYSYSAFFALGLGFFVMTSDPMCAPDIPDCLAHVCSITDQNQRHTYFPTTAKSLVYDFGTYYICEKAYIITIVTTLKTVGQFVSYMASSIIVDHYGRKFAITLICSCASIGYILLALSWRIQVAAVAFFVIGLSTQGIYIANFFFNEQVDYTKRQYYSMAVQIFFGLSGIGNALIFKFVVDWRLITFIFLVGPAICGLLLTYFIVQTPQFLIKNDPKFALKQFQYMAKLNKADNLAITLQDINNVKYHQAQIERLMTKSKLTFIDLCRYKSLRTVSICTTMVLFALLTMYMGPSLIVQSFGLDIYFSQILFSVTQVITYIIAFFAITKIPRRKFGIFAFAVIVAINVTILFLNVPKDCDKCLLQYVNLILYCVIRFFLSLYFSVFWLFFSELFPEKARGLGVGTSSLICTAMCIPVYFLLPNLVLAEINVIYVFLPISIIGLVFLIPLRQTKNIKLQEQIEQISDQQQERQSVKQSTKSNQQSVRTSTKSNCD